MMASFYSRVQSVSARPISALCPLAMLFGVFLILATGPSRAVAQSDPLLFWTKVIGPWGGSFDGSFGAIAVHPTNSNIIFIGSSVPGGPGVLKSSDGGATWVAKNAGIDLVPLTSEYPLISKIAFAPSNPDIMYLGAASDFSGGIGYIYRSADGGNTWQLAKGQTSIIYGYQISNPVFDLDVDPQHPFTVYAAVAGQGVMKTTNGGADWSNIFRSVVSENETGYVNAIRVSPVDPNTILFTYFISISEGAIPILNLVDPDNNSIGSSGILPSSVYKSTNGGSSWSILTGPSEPAAITDLQYEPASGNWYVSTISYMSTLYWPVNDFGLYRSSDSGQSWQSINQATFGSLDQVPFVAMSTNPSSVNKGLFASSGFGNLIVGSTDAGSHWARLDPSLLNAYIGRTAVAGNRFFALTTLGIFFTDITSFYAPATPAIAVLNPTMLWASNSPQTITITGSNFQSSGPGASTLVFYDPASNPYARTPYNVTPTSMQYDINVQSATGMWKVKVVNGSVESLPFSFTVGSSGVQLTGLSISGPAAVAENNSGQFTATAYFSDSSSSTVTSSTSWSQNSGVASISSSGFFSAGGVNIDTAVTVSASYTSNGVTKTTSAKITIVNSGSGGGSAIVHALVNGNFESGSSPWTPSGYAGILAGSYPHSGSYYGYLCNANSAAGSFSQFFPLPAGTTGGSIQFYLNIVTAETAVYTAYDTMKIDLVTANEQYVGTIAQFSNLDKGANVDGSYVFKSYDITSMILPYRGQSMYLVFSGQSDTSRSTIFRVDDVDVSLTVNSPISLTGLSIRGASSIPEGQGSAYWADAIFSDGTTQTISPNSWSENSSVTTISSDGFLLAGSVSSDTPVTVTASYTFNGVAQQATKDITIVDTIATHSLTSLAISGPSSLNENSSGQFTATAIFADGTSQTVTPSWSENSTATSISIGGLLTAGNVTGDTIVTASASYTIGGVTRNASQDVLIINLPTPPTLASLGIGGPTSVTESSTAQYSATASFSDGSSQVVNAIWRENSAATSISSSGVLSVEEVTSDTSVTISADYTINGVTRSASRSVTIINVATAGTSPSFTTQPSNRSVVVGGAVSFTAVASGSPTPTLKWQVRTSSAGAWTDVPSGAPYTGQTSATLTLTGVGLGLNGYQYRCLASNSVQSNVASNTVTLTVFVISPSDFDGDGRSDVLWRNSGTGQIGVWTTVAGRYLNFGTEAGGWQVIGVGDFDGDGRTEPLFRNSNTTQICSWPMAGGYLNFGTDGGLLQVIGTGDFDGDGRSEPLWRNATTTQICTWTMAGHYLNFGTEGGVWKVIGVGDFDGDGRSEPLWRNTTTTLNCTWTMAAGYLNFGTESGVWKVVKVGDFDGDGRSEPLWRNSVTTQNCTWTMAGRYLNFGTDSGVWQVIDVGDFDADGRSEPLWRNTNTKQICTWPMAGGYLNFGIETAGWLVIRF